MAAPLTPFHNRSVRSAEAETILEPSAENAQAVTPAVCPERTVKHGERDCDLLTQRSHARVSSLASCLRRASLAGEVESG